MTDLKPADALQQHWTDALPARVEAVRAALAARPADRLAIAAAAVLDGHRGRAHRVRILLGRRALTRSPSSLGAIAMRGAGCTYNDILDRDIDAKVERTRLRPLPSGAVSLKAAWVWLLAQCLVGLVVLLTLPPAGANRRADRAAAGRALSADEAHHLVAAGLARHRVLVGRAGRRRRCRPIETDVVPLEAFALYAGCICWTIGYDTIYALQDREDDALVGVRSTARLFADKWRTWTSVFYVAGAGASGPPPRPSPARASLLRSR